MMKTCIVPFPRKIKHQHLGHWIAVGARGDHAIQPVSPFPCMSCMFPVCDQCSVSCHTTHSHNHMQEEMNGEDVSDPHVLESVKTAVIQNKSVKRIVIEGSRLRWTNVAIAIIEGAQQNTALKELKLETPVIPGLQVVVEKLRKAKPKLQLVVKAGDGECSYPEY